jgi:uncharacterized protein (TIGR00266 family)
MEVELLNRPASTIAKVKLAAQETVVAEGGSMISMSSGVGISTTTQQKGKGGILKGLKRLLAGESFFMNHFSASNDGDEVTLGTTLSGDMEVIDVPSKVIVEAGSFVCCESQVGMDLGWQGFKSMFSGEGLFWINLTGPGKVVVNSYGAIYCVEVDGEYIVDTGMIVGFEETLSFKISKATKSWIGSFFSGEGLICRFQGKGKVWVQSHSRTAFGFKLGPMLAPRS